MTQSKQPNRIEAENIWQQGINYRLSRPYPFVQKDEYVFHTKGVAAAAEAIAQHINGIDTEKAYVFGLLHDYGKRINQAKENKFHGQEGFEQMRQMGYDEVAQICLTHTFPKKDFGDEEFSFPKEWLDWSRQELQNVEYTDYDLLICLCDKFFEGFNMVSIERRVEAIASRYSLDDYQKKVLYTQSMGLKNYFDEKTGTDIYKILKIKD